VDLIKNNTSVSFKEIPKYPAVRRDLALELDKSVDYKDVYDLAFDTERKLLAGVDLFDVYEGNKIAEGKYLMRWVLSVQDKFKTLEAISK